MDRTAIVIANCRIQWALCQLRKDEFNKEHVMTVLQDAHTGLKAELDRPSSVVRVGHTVKNSASSAKLSVKRAINKVANKIASRTAVPA